MERQKTKQNGITLIALVISIIVMLILAGVSLNLTIGDNGIIKQAKNATYQTGMAILEEWLQQEYVKYYDENDDYATKVELLIFKHPNMFLKDGTNNYILSPNQEGAISKYYLINKSNLPQEIRNSLVGGDTTEYNKYIRLMDVYGVTPDLKVYYMSDGVNGDTVLGSLDNEEVDPSTPLVKINKDTGLKNAINSALGFEEGHNLTIGEIQGLKKLNLDGNQNTITSLSALAEATSLQELTLSNLTLENLDGLQNCIFLRYIYFRNCNIRDYSNLSSVYKLDTLYMYLPSSMLKNVANAQVNALSLGLKEASNLTKLTTLGISGIENMFTKIGTYISDDTVYNVGYGEYASQLDDITSLKDINSIIRNNIQILYLNNNSISNVSVLSNFPNITKAYLFRNSSLTSLGGLESHLNLNFLAANFCGLTSISGLRGCSKLSTCYINGNSGLSSLNGLQDSLKVVSTEITNKLIAYSCNITDITALANNGVIEYLSLYSNVNLEEVSTLGDLINLKNLYLANNEKMIGTQIKTALNNSTTHILQNCGSNYSLPSKYLIYFGTLTSYNFSNMDLTDTSDEIEAMLDRTDVERLNLSGNPKLTDSKLQTILSSMTGLKALSLNGCSKLASINFIGEGKVTQLTELDIRGTASTLTDLSNLETYGKSLKTLLIDNTATDMSKIQETINTLWTNREGQNVYSWFSKEYWGCRGLLLRGKLAEYSFENCTSIESFVYEDTGLNVDYSGSLNLSEATNIEKVRIFSNSFRGKMPSSLVHYNRTSGVACDLSLCSNLVTYDAELGEEQILAETATIPATARITAVTTFRFGPKTFKFLNNINTSELTTISYSANGSSFQASNLESLEGLNSATNLETLTINGTLNFSTTPMDFSGLTKLKTLSISDCPNLQKIIIVNDKNEGSKELTRVGINGKNIINVEGLEKISALESLSVFGTSVSDISFVSNMTSLTYLYLYKNAINDLKPINDLINNSTNKKLKFTSLNLESNSIPNTSISGTNNINAIINLWNAGCKTIKVKSNSFQDTSGLAGYSGISYDNT